MKQLFLVFLGGGLGSMLRYFIAKHLNLSDASFFWGTFTVNILGCLLIGVLLGCFTRGRWLTEQQLLLWATGFCGGFTTFSTFAFEQQKLLKSGEILSFSLYTLGSVGIGILAVSCGIWISKSL
ncbi:MAG: fluoride efflux transporter CrcB [Bacteroidota bacterium]